MDDAVSWDDLNKPEGTELGFGNRCHALGCDAIVLGRPPFCMNHTPSSVTTGLPGVGTLIDTIYHGQRSSFPGQTPGPFPPQIPEERRPEPVMEDQEQMGAQNQIDYLASGSIFPLDAERKRLDAKRVARKTVRARNEPQTYPATPATAQHAVTSDPLAAPLTTPAMFQPNRGVWAPDSSFGEPTVNQDSSNLYSSPSVLTPRRDAPVVASSTRGSSLAIPPSYIAQTALELVTRQLVRPSPGVPETSKSPERASILPVSTSSTVPPHRPKSTQISQDIIDLTELSDEDDNHIGPVLSEPVFSEPVFSEPVFSEPVFSQTFLGPGPVEPDLSEPDHAEPVAGPVHDNRFHHIMPMGQGSLPRGAPAGQGNQESKSGSWTIFDLDTDNTVFDLDASPPGSDVGPIESNSPEYHHHSPASANIVIQDQQGGDDDVVMRRLTTPVPGALQDSFGVVHQTFHGLDRPSSGEPEASASAPAEVTSPSNNGSHIQGDEALADRRPFGYISCLAAARSATPTERIAVEGISSGLPEVPAGHLSISALFQLPISQTEIEAPRGFAQGPDEVTETDIAKVAETGSPSPQFSKKEATKSGNQDCTFALGGSLRPLLYPSLPSAPPESAQEQQEEIQVRPESAPSPVPHQVPELIDLTISEVEASSDEEETAQASDGPPSGNTRTGSETLGSVQWKHLSTAQRQAYINKHHDAELLDSFIYGAANEPFRPGSKTFARNFWELPIRPGPPPSNLRFAVLDPRVHYPQNSSEYSRKQKQDEIASRGRRKSRVGKAAVSRMRQTQATIDKAMSDLPRHVLENPQWVAAVREMISMEARSHAQRLLKLSEAEQYQQLPGDPPLQPPGSVPFQYVNPGFFSGRYEELPKELTAGTTAITAAASSSASKAAPSRPSVKRRSRRSATAAGAATRARLNARANAKQWLSKDFRPARKAAPG